MKTFLCDVWMNQRSPLDLAIHSNRVPTSQSIVRRTYHQFYYCLFQILLVFQSSKYVISNSRQIAARLFVLAG